MLFVSSKTPSTELGQVLASTRKAFLVVALFSLVINVLMLTAPLYMLQVYNRVLGSGSTETLIMLTLMAAVAVAIMSVLETLRTTVTVRIGCWLNDRVSPIFMQSGVRARLKGDPSGVQPFHDISAIQNFIATQGLTAFFDSPWVPLFIAVIWMLHPVLGITALVSALLLLALTFINDWVTKKSMAEASAKQIDATRMAEATIRNADVVQAMGLLPSLIARWSQTNGQSVDAVRRAGEIGGVVMAVTKFVRMFVQIAILGIGAWLVLKNELTAGGMIAASILLGRALAPVEMALGAWKNYTVARLAYQRLADHLSEHQAPPPRTQLPEPVGRLEVRNITYVLPKSTHMVLSQVSMSVEPGEAVAIVGPSGAGKSTLCRLLVGLDNPSFGSVRLDGSELRHWDPRQLGDYVGYLPQDVELFNGTVRENIARMGNIDDDEVVRAAQIANVHQMIQELPEGYDTRLGIGGIQLSGGQRQRVGLARAVFGRPKLIVLDEPNANLDRVGDEALTAALAGTKTRGQAVVLISHRVQAMGIADTLLYLDRGVQRAFGPQAEVLKFIRQGVQAQDAAKAVAARAG
jgi:ATP-binding cassette subfamily C protein/ATP-binding cassette subfamily C exporter for protease/lipase/ATP-binding cassette subfamily C protein EexD